MSLRAEVKLVRAGWEEMVLVDSPSCCMNSIRARNFSSTARQVSSSSLLELMPKLGRKVSQFLS